MPITAATTTTTTSRRRSIVVFSVRCNSPFSSLRMSLSVHVVAGKRIQLECEVTVFVCTWCGVCGVQFSRCLGASVQVGSGRKAFC